MDEHDGKLIDRPNIKQAINVFRYHARKAGLSGVKSPHSMRYHFSQEARRFYRKMDIESRKSTLVFLWILVMVTEEVVM